MKKRYIISLFCACLGLIGLLFSPAQKAYAIDTVAPRDISIVSSVSGTDNLDVQMLFMDYSDSYIDSISIVDATTTIVDEISVITNASTVVSYTGNEYPLYSKDYNGVSYDCMELSGTGSSSKLTLGVKNSFRGTINLQYTSTYNDQSLTKDISVKVGKTAAAPTITMAKPAGDTNTFDSTPGAERLTVPIFYDLTEAYMKSFFTVSAPAYESIGGLKLNNNIVMEPWVDFYYDDASIPRAAGSYGDVVYTIVYTPRLEDGTFCSENVELSARFDLEVSNYFEKIYIIPYNEGSAVVNAVKTAQDEGRTVDWGSTVDAVDGLSIGFLIHNQEGIDITSIFTPDMFTLVENASVQKQPIGGVEIFICTWQPTNIGQQTGFISVDYDGNETPEQTLRIRTTFVADGVPVVTLKAGDITISPKSDALQTQITEAAKGKIDSVEDEFFTLSVEDVVIEIKKAGTEDEYVTLATWLVNTYDETCSGEYTLRYSVTNGSSITSEYVTKTMTITDSKPTINQFAFATSYTYTHESNTIISGSFVGADIDMGDSIKYVWDLNNSNLSATLNESTGAFSITVNDSYIGTVAFQYWTENTDGTIQQSDKRSASFTVSYTDNTAPAITLDNTKLDTAPSNIPNSVNSSIRTATNWKVVNKGQNLNLSELISSVVDDYDTSIEIADIEYTMIVSGRNATLNNEVFSGTSEDYSYIRCKVRDITNNVSDVYIAVKVQNRIPVLATVQLTDTVSYTDTTVPITYSDPDGDAVGVETETRITNGVTIASIGNVSYSSSEGAFILVLSDNYVGTAQFRFRLYDLGGFTATTRNYTEYFTMTVEVEDDVAPVVTVDNTLPREFVVSRTYSPIVIADYVSAIDHIDGEITPVILQTSANAFDKDVVGTYSYRFAFTDEAGNSSVENITLTVVGNAAPVITLSQTSKEIFVNEEFDIYSFITRISDEEDGNITEGFAELENLTITDLPENTKNAGKYTIYLSYVDNDGKSSQILTFELSIVKKTNLWWVVWLSVGIAAAAIAGIIVWRIIRFKKISRV